MALCRGRDILRSCRTNNGLKRNGISLQAYLCNTEDTRLKHARFKQARNLPPARMQKCWMYLSAVRVPGANVRRCRTKMPAEGAIEIGQVVEARFGGNVGNLAMAQTRIAQQHRGAFEAAFQHVMREALAGFFQEQMHVARRDAERACDCRHA